MKTTICKLCKGAGRIPAKGYNNKTVCTACSGVGKITTADTSEPTGQNDSKPQEPTSTHPDLHLPTNRGHIYPQIPTCRCDVTCYVTCYAPDPPTKP